MARRNGSAGLGIGQLFVIIFGFLITSALIFLFGIWVGRDIAERRLAQEERVVRMPIATPLPAKEEPKREDVDATFFEKLKAQAEKRLEETATIASPTLTRSVQVVTPTRAAPRLPEGDAAMPTMKPKHPDLPKPTAAAKPGEEWADAGWTVQVNATTSPEQANELAQRLRAKGYDAYTLQAPMHGQTWYRVRVGRFPTRDKARELEGRLKNDEGLQNAYVTPK